MLARVLRLSQLLELAACLALSAWLFHGHPHRMEEIVAATVAWFLGVRLALVCISSALAWWYGATPASGQRIGWAAAVRMLLAEWRALLAFNLVDLPWDRYRVRPDPVPQPTGRMPVLLVHGYFANRGYFRPLLRRLEGRGVGPIFTPNFPGCLASIERFAEELDAEIERIAAGTGQAKVMLVVHSMGGLAARAYLARRGTARVAKLITIASPHHGTELARLSLGRSARQMQPGSAFLVALEQREGPAGPGVDTVSLYSPQDNMVTPPDTCRLAWARNVAMPGYGHIAILDSAALADALVPELEAAGVRAVRQSGARISAA